MHVALGLRHRCSTVELPIGRHMPAYCTIESVRAALCNSTRKVVCGSNLTIAPFICVGPDLNAARDLWNLVLSAQCAG